MPASQYIIEFQQTHQLPVAFLDQVEQYYLPWADSIATQHRQTKIIAISGLQGAGKSTLAALMQLILSERYQLRAVQFSLDDLYLPKAERKRLARDIHPLLQTRGVPGTHDVALGIELLSDIQQGTGAVDLPCFDKSTDERCSQWRKIYQPVDILFFEGWCLGAQAQSAAELQQPINVLEANEDSHGTWRSYVNQCLAGSYQELFAMVDEIVYLQLNSWDAVIKRRFLQELQLRRETGGGMNDVQLQRFMQHYQRISLQQMKHMPEVASQVFPA